MRFVVLVNWLILQHLSLSGLSILRGRRHIAATMVQLEEVDDETYEQQQPGPTKEDEDDWSTDSGTHMTSSLIHLVLTAFESQKYQT